MAKMNHWRAGKLYRKSTLDWRWETLVPDRAGRWLRAVERNQREAHRHSIVVGNCCSDREMSMSATELSHANSVSASGWPRCSARCDGTGDEND